MSLEIGDEEIAKKAVSTYIGINLYRLEKEDGIKVGQEKINKYLQKGKGLGDQLKNSRSPEEYEFFRNVFEDMMNGEASGEDARKLSKMLNEIADVYTRHLAENNGTDSTYEKVRIHKQVDRQVDELKDNSNKK